jgi:hypothetical protein
MSNKERNDNNEIKLETSANGKGFKYEVGEYVHLPKESTNLAIHKFIVRSKERGDDNNNFYSLQLVGYHGPLNK